MFELKPLSKEAIPAALEKANCYRFLNEPVEAESICLDILEVDPDNQQALITLVLALTDQFEHDLSQPFSKAVEIHQRLQEDYNRSYCHGIICERRAKAHLDRGGPGSGHIAYDWLHKAMQSAVYFSSKYKGALIKIIRCPTGSAGSFPSQLVSKEGGQYAGSKYFIGF